MENKDKRYYKMRVLFIDIDTLRPDHLGCYGYKEILLQTLMQ